MSSSDVLGIHFPPNLPVPLYRSFVLRGSGGRREHGASVRDRKDREPKRRPERKGRDHRLRNALNTNTVRENSRQLEYFGLCVKNCSRRGERVADNRNVVDRATVVPGIVVVLRTAEDRASQPVPFFCSPVGSLFYLW